MTNHTSTVGTLFVALSSLGYATNPIFAKLAYQTGTDTITLMATRFTLATLLLWLIVALGRRSPGPSLPRRLRLLALGAGGMAMISLLYFTAVRHIDASLATGLFYTYPAMVAVIGLVRGERLDLKGYAGLLLTLAGTWLLLGSGGGGFTWQGAALILAGAATYAVYLLLGNRWTEGINPFVTTAHLTTGCALVFLLLALVLGKQPPASPLAYTAGAGLALFSTVFAMVTFFKGLPLLGPTRTSIISVLEPAFTVVLAVLFLGDSIGLPQLAGIVLIVAGAAAAQTRQEPAVPGKAA